VPLERKKRFLRVWGIRSSGANKIGLGGNKRFENGKLQAMIRKRVNSLLSRMRYLGLQAEINVLMGFNGVRRELDFRKVKP
jgi:hypothetical protein